MKIDQRKGRGVIGSRTQCAPTPLQVLITIIEKNKEKENLSWLGGLPGGGTPLTLTSALTSPQLGLLGIF